MVSVVEVLVVIQYSVLVVRLVYRECSGKKGSIYKVMKSFICSVCMNPVTGTGRTSVDIADDANLELVDKFYYFVECGWRC